MGFSDDFGQTDWQENFNNLLSLYETDDGKPEIKKKSPLYEPEDKSTEDARKRLAANQKIKRHVLIFSLPLVLLSASSTIVFLSLFLLSPIAVVLFLPTIVALVPSFLIGSIYSAAALAPFVFAFGAIASFTTTLVTGFGLFQGINSSNTKYNDAYYRVNASLDIFEDFLKDIEFNSIDDLDNLFKENFILKRKLRFTPFTQKYAAIEDVELYHQQLLFYAAAYLQKSGNKRDNENVQGLIRNISEAEISLLKSNYRHKLRRLNSYFLGPLSWLFIIPSLIVPALTTIGLLTSVAFLSIFFMPAAMLASLVGSIAIFSTITALATLTSYALAIVSTLITISLGARYLKHRYFDKILASNRTKLVPALNQLLENLSVVDTASVDSSALLIGNNHTSDVSLDNMITKGFRKVFNSKANRRWETPETDNSKGALKHQ